MLMVKTKLNKSRIHGIGLFADENIKKGKIIWKNNKGLTYLVYDKKKWLDYVKKLSPESARQIGKYTYEYNRDGKYYLCLDDTRFINHSNNPNIQEDKAGNDVALRFIKRGDEITIDYNSFC